MQRALQVESLLKLPGKGEFCVAAREPVHFPREHAHAVFGRDESAIAVDPSAEVVVCASQAVEKAPARWRRGVVYEVRVQMNVTDVAEQEQTPEERARTSDRAARAPTTPSPGHRAEDHPAAPARKPFAGLRDRSRLAPGVGRAQGP